MVSYYLGTSTGASITLLLGSVVLPNPPAEADPLTILTKRTARTMSELFFS